MALNLEEFGLHDPRPPKPLNKPLNDAEMRVIHFMDLSKPAHVRMPSGGFVTSLIETICQADPTNAKLLALGFPALVAAVLDWKFGNLADRAEYHAGIGDPT